MERTMRSLLLRAYLCCYCCWNFVFAVSRTSTPTTTLHRRQGGDGLLSPRHRHHRSRHAHACGWITGQLPPRGGGSSSQSSAENESDIEEEETANEEWEDDEEALQSTRTPLNNEQRAASAAADDDTNDYDDEIWSEEEQDELTEPKEGADVDDADDYDDDNDDDENIDVFLDAQEFIDDDESVVDDDEILYEYVEEEEDDDDEDFEPVLIQDETLGTDSDSVESRQIVVEETLQVGENSEFDDEEIDETDVEFAYEIEPDGTREADFKLRKPPQNDTDGTVQDVLLEEQGDGNNEGSCQSDDEFEDDLDENVPVGTVFETPEVRNDTSPSTEDASQIEPEFSQEVQAEMEDAVEETDNAGTDDVYAKEKADAMVSSQETLAVAAMVEAETAEEETAFVAATQAATRIRPETIDLSPQHTTDDDSMAFEDRMQLADDEGEAVLSEFPEQGMLEVVDEVVDTVGVDDGTELEVVGPNLPLNEEDTNEVVVESQALDQNVPIEESPITRTTSRAVIDDETKRILMKELKFRRREVNEMRPEVAVIIAEKRLRRPCEGIPPNWYADEAQHKQPVARQRARLLRTALLPIVYAVPIVLSGLAVYGSADLAHLVSSLSSSDASSGKPDEKEEEVRPPLPAEYETENLSQPSLAGTGGIAPFDETSIPTKEEDESWLDKIITGVAKPLKAFWEMEI